jgi:predicted outer membrane repeat protein
MGFSSWLRKLTSNRAPRGRTPHRPASPRFRPRLEALEDRTVPSSGLTTLTVTSLADSGKGTLRDAILHADKGPSSKTYEIDIAVAGTILLESSLPDLANTITINGVGTNQTLIQRDTLAAPFRILTVDAGQTAALSALSIAQGNAGSGDGGAIDNFGALTLTNCALYANTAGQGGAVCNEAGATLTVTGTSFTGNSASGYGGAIQSDGTLAASGAWFANNSAQLAGGGIASDGVATFSGSSFSGNTASSKSALDGGGAIWNDGTLTVQVNSILSSNSAPFGGAIMNLATATVTVTTFANNSATTGGAIFNNAGTLTASGAWFTNNTAVSGGAIWNFGTLTVRGTAASPATPPRLTAEPSATS